MTQILGIGTLVVFTAIFFTGSIMASSKIVEICESPAVAGSTFCRTEEERWTFNSEDEKCIVFDGFGGCGQTENNFGSKEDCEKACGNYKDEPEKRTKTYPAACSLKSGKSERCRAAFPAYFYDKKSKSCKEFTYGGCGGNANLFFSSADCEHYCGNL